MKRKKNLSSKALSGSVVVMGNTSLYKRDKLKTAIKESSKLLEYLTPYSSNSNPIEYKWA